MTENMKCVLCGGAVPTAPRYMLEAARCRATSFVRPEDNLPDAVVCTACGERHGAGGEELDLEFLEEFPEN
jgi:hypothetical protein